LQALVEAPEHLPKSLKKSFQALNEQQQPALARLTAKGLCYHQGEICWINGDLLAAYVARIEGRIRGRIWLDEDAKVIYQGQSPVEELTALQYEILRFFITNPRSKHTRDDIIDNAWPEEDQREGITPNALQVHIASIRKKIEPNPAQPRYLITWHGRPGGYQFFPEGKPG
jgi:DNA-binding response OmpR family regulator